MSLIANTKASFNYEILERLEAGVELLGLEVKSIRAGQGSLLGAFVKILGSEAFLINADIPPFQPANTPKGYDPLRARKLIIGKKEILSLEHKTMKEGLTILPISMYNKGSKLKVELAIARGKKKGDKRETTKRRESDREIHRVIKGER